MNHYTQLGVAQTATQEEIKRAYFRQVRRFTPEKDPEAFMRIRQAYETLSDETARAEYDARLSKYADMPEEIAQILLEVERLAEKELYVEAAGLLKQSKFRSHHAVLITLCNLYLAMDKTGKAVGIAEKLVKSDPNNAEYLRIVINAYIARGWTNKALPIIDDLELLDPGNEDNMMVALDGEMDLPLTRLAMAVERAERYGKKAPLLCAKIATNCFFGEEDHSDARYEQLSLESFLEPSEEDLWDWYDPMFATKKLAEHTVDIPDYKRELVKEVLERLVLHGIYYTDRYDILPQVDQVIANIGADKIFQSSQYRVAKAGHAALEAVMAGIPKKLAALSLMRIWSLPGYSNEQDTLDFQNEALDLEFEILVTYLQLRPHIERFKSAFPTLYQHSSDFFEMLGRANEIKIENEAHRRFSKLKHRKMRLSLDWLGEDDEMEWNREPVRVTKIGRNEPCPCGSGKKYKKCCGQ